MVLTSCSCLRRRWCLPCQSRVDEQKFFVCARILIKTNFVQFVLIVFSTDTFVNGTLLAKTEQLSVEQSNSARFGILNFCVD